MLVFNINGIKTDKMKDTVIKRSIGDLDRLSFELTNDFKDFIQSEKIVDTPYGNFIIKEFNKNEKRILVKCKYDVTDLQSMHRANVVLTKSTLKANLDELLSGTSWTSQGTNMTVTGHITLNQVNVFEALSEMQKKYDCEFRYDNQQKIVYFAPRLGENRGTYFAEGLNLEEIDELEESYELITRIVPVGMNGLTINAINGGKDYLQNLTYNKKIITLYWKDERYTNIEHLKADAQKKLDVLSVPRKVYDIKVKDLSKQSKYKILEYDVGDTAKIISKDIVQKHRIIECELHLNNLENNTCKLANKPVDIKSTIQDLQKEMSDNWSRTEVEFKVLDDRIVQAVTTTKKYTDDSFETYKSERVQTDQEIRESITHSTTYVDPKTGQTKPVVDKMVETVKNLDGVSTSVSNNQQEITTVKQTVQGVGVTAQNANSKAEQALTADAYTRTIANRADGNASTAIQKANSIEFQFQNYSPDRVKYGTTYALTPSECYIAYNGQRKFQVSTYTGDVSTEGSFKSQYFTANNSGVTIKNGYGSTCLQPSGDSLQLWGIRSMNNLTMLGNLIMNGSTIFNGGNAITFNTGTTYPIELWQGVECMNGLYVHGAKNAVVETKEGTKAVNCYETAEYYFGDLGQGKIDEDGQCVVIIEDVFSQTVNTEIEYLVFLTKEGQGDIWVTEKSPFYFVVKGSPNLKFNWEIKAKRKGYEHQRLETIQEKRQSIIDTMDDEFINSNIADIENMEVGEI